MKPDIFQHYKLTLGKKGKNQSSIEKVINVNTGKIGFSKPSTNRSEKLYLVSYKSEIIYVGITGQSISARMRAGLMANGKNGYHGYKWKNLIRVDLIVWSSFEKKEINKKYMKEIETIEGELVYFIRKKTGKWPKYQTEIHFHNSKKNFLKTIRSMYNIGTKYLENN